MDQETICVVEDDAAIRRGIVDSLRHAGYRVLECPDGTAARRVLASELCHGLLLDVMLPDMDGLEYLVELRTSRPRLPVIMVTARGAEEDRVRGLRLGADDYVVKPFSATELIARVEAVLRRALPDPLPHARLESKDCTVDLVRREVRLHSGAVRHLSERETELLAFLAASRSSIVSRGELLRGVWHMNPRGIDTRTVDMAVARVREKCGRAMIETRRGVGYIMGSQVKRCGPQRDQ